jgi:putative endonuclease
MSVGRCEAEGRRIPSSDLAPRSKSCVIASPTQPGVAIHPRNERSGRLLRRAASREDTGVSDKNYYVYILANRKNGTPYTEVTNSLQRRVWQHRHKVSAGFTAKYGVDRLVYLERFEEITNAIAREKQIKAGSRAKKIALIEKENPQWRDLSADWF